MPTPEQIQAYIESKANGDLSFFPTETQAKLALEYEPLIGGTTTEKITSKLSGLGKEVTTKYPFAPPGMTSMVPVPQNKTPFPDQVEKQNLFQTYKKEKPTVTSTMEGPPSLRNELVNQADKVINMVARGTMVPLASQMVGGPDLYGKLNALTGQTESEMQAAPGWQTFFGELPGNILGGEVVAAAMVPVAGAAAATTVGAATIAAAAKAFPTVAKVAKAIAPTISKSVAVGIEKQAVRQAEIASQTVSDFVTSFGGKVNDKVARAAMNQGFPLEKANVKSLQKLMDIDSAAKDVGGRGVVRTQSMTPDELDSYMANKFNFVPSKGKAADSILVTDQELVNKVGEKLNQGVGTGSPDMTKFQAITPENMGGAPTMEKIGPLNISQIPTKTEDFRGFVQQMAYPNKELLYEARLKGSKSLSFEEAAQMGDDLGMNLNYFQTRKLGAAWDPVEAASIRRLMNEKMYPDLMALKKKIDFTDPKQAELWIEQLGQTFQTQANIAGGTSEAARSVAYAKGVSPIQKLRERVAKIFRGGFDSTNPMVKKRVLEASQHLDLDDHQSMGAFIQSLGSSKWKQLTDANFELWVNGVLSNPVTHAKNITGNTFTTLTVPVEKAAAGFWDAAITKTGKLFGKKMTRDRFIGEAVQAYSGQAHGVMEGTQDFLKTMAGAESRIGGVGKLGADHVRIPAIPGKTGRFLRIPGTALRAEDDFFKMVNYKGELYSQSYRQASKEGLKGEARLNRMTELNRDPVKAMENWAMEATQGKSQKTVQMAVTKARAIGHKMEEAAFAAAKVQTFTNELGAIGKTLSYVIKTIPGLRYVQPFMNTSANILKYGLKRTPLGLVRLGKEGLTKGQASDILGQVTLGSAAMGGATLGATTLLGDKKSRPSSEPDAKALAAWTLASGGFAKIYADGGMTGAAPSDPEIAKGWYQSGKIPYAIRIGDKYVSFKDLGPMGITLGVMADAMDMWGQLEQEDSATSLGLMMLNASQTYLNQSYTSGLSDLMKAYSDPKRYGPKMWNRFIQGEIPYSGMLKFIGNLSDQTLRKPENSWQALQAVIPFARTGVPPMYTIWGDEVKFQGGALGAMSPIRFSQVSFDKATQEVDRLQIQPGSINRILDKKLNYTSPAYYLAQQIRGQRAKMYIDRLVNQASFKNADDITKTDQLKTMFEMAGKHTNIQLGVTVKTKAAKLLMQKFDHAKAKGNDVEMEQVKNMMKTLVSRQMRGVLPKTKELYQTQVIESGIVE